MLYLVLISFSGTVLLVLFWELDFNFRIHQLFKAKLGLLGEEEGDGYLTGFLLKAGAFLHLCVLNKFNVIV